MRDSSRARATLGSGSVILVALLTWATPGLLVGTARADDGDAVALVNGRPVSRETFVDTLVEAHGVEILQQIIVVQLAKQESKRRGMQVTQSDVEAEYQDTLDRIAERAGMTPDQATQQNKLDALKVLLRERDISMAEFQLAIERNAHLRRLAQAELKITEATLREEFARTYGERVLVRHIQIERNDRSALNEALNLLQHGADFGDVARRISRNPDTAARGGEMDPFTFTDAQIPEALREMAFSLKPGEVSSPVLTNRYCHILKLEARIPPDDVRFEDVRAQVEREVNERAVPKEMSRLALELYKKSKINVLDAELRPRYQQFLNEGNLNMLEP